MSSEVIPEPYRQPFDPLRDVDHEAVILYTEGRLMTGGGVVKEIQRLHRVNVRSNQQLMDRLVSYEKFLEPYNDDLELTDPNLERMRIFFRGTSVALAATANLAYELNMGGFDWRKQWVELPVGIDAPCNVTAEQMKTSADCYRIGAALLEVGNRNLAMLEGPYQAMVERLDMEHGVAGPHGNVFAASFGYVFGVGRRILHDEAYPRAVEQAVQEAMLYDDETTVDAFDEEYRALIETEYPIV